MTASLGTGAPAALAEAQPAADCTSVSGHLTAVGIPQVDDGRLVGFHVVVTSATGDLAADDIWADLRVVFAAPGGALQLDGTHHFVDPAGHELLTDDFVRISPDGVVDDTLRIVDGGSGTLHTHGSVDLTTGAVDLDYWGRVCG